jgi:Fe-S-cluster-containing dehydrogenase component
MRLIISPHKCRGCLRCEMACSFHKSGHKFVNPSISSTRVVRNDANYVFQIFLDSTCDLCENEKEPLCVSSCVFGARRFVR